MDDFDPERADEDRYIVCSNLIACHTLWYDNTNTDCGYSLGRVIVQVRPPDGSGYPFLIHRLFLYAQAHGTPGEYLVRVRFVEIGTDDGEEVEQELGQFGPWEIAIPGDNYVECFGLPILNVRFAAPGTYEFQLWADGFDGPLGRERFQARE